MKRPSKEFLYRRVRRALNGRHFDTALDLACGVMRMAPHIDAKAYVGLDLDEGALAEGIRRGANRRAIVSTIEEMPADLSGDLVLCLQTIGINRFARVELTMTHVSKMIAATRDDGMLILNVGAKSAAYFDLIERELRQAFRSVDVVNYGRFRSHVPFPIFTMLARAMEQWPQMAVDDANPVRLYLADGRSEAKVGQG